MAKQNKDSSFETNYKSGDQSGVRVLRVVYEP